MNQCKQSDAERRVLLSALPYQLAREHGTEPALVADTRTHQSLGNFPLRVPQHAPLWLGAQIRVRDGLAIPSCWPPIGELQVRSTNDASRFVERSEFRRAAATLPSTLGPGAAATRTACGSKTADPVPGRGLPSTAPRTVGTMR